VVNSPIYTYTFTHTPPASPTESPLPSATHTPVDTATLTPTPEPPTPGPSPTDSPVASATPTPVDTPTATPTPVPPTAVPTATFSPMVTAPPATATPTTAVPGASPDGPVVILRSGPLNQPNPLSLRVQMQGSAESSELSLYDPAMRCVFKLLPGPLQPGWNEIPLPPELRQLSNGTYFYRLTAQRQGRQSDPSAGRLVVLR
jgi:hypothetical protein